MFQTTNQHYVDNKSITAYDGYNSLHLYLMSMAYVENGWTWHEIEFLAVLRWIKLMKAPSGVCVWFQF